MPTVPDQKRCLSDKKKGILINVHKLLTKFSEYFSGLATKPSFSW